MHASPAFGLSRCLGCGAAALRPLYTVRGLPVRLHQLASTRAAALDVPAGDLELAFCPGCGLIQNVALPCQRRGIGIDPACPGAERKDGSGALH